MTEGPFFFGCRNNGPGHYLCDSHSRSFRESSLPKSFPFKWEILDGGLLPPGIPEVQGQASLVHFPGWTVLTFWDRSVDNRPGSSAAFLFNSHMTFEEIVIAAKAAFPHVWWRFTFEVVEWKGE